MTAEELEKLIKEGKMPEVLDVRSGFEFGSGHIEGAVHAPLSRLFQVAKTVCPDKSGLLVIVCEHGPRAQLALALLKMRGYKQLALLAGHMHKWRQSGRPIH